MFNAQGERFTDELPPRDVVAKAILKQLDLDQKPYVWLSLQAIHTDTILHHFPNIYTRCLQEGYDITKEPVPVVPAQHYFMGGIQIDLKAAPPCSTFYAAGETACNGVHGANRLASNSLLESLVFAQRAAYDMEAHQADAAHFQEAEKLAAQIDLGCYQDIRQLQQAYQRQVQEAIQTEKGRRQHA